MSTARRNFIDRRATLEHPDFVVLIATLTTDGLKISIEQLDSVKFVVINLKQVKLRIKFVAVRHADSKHSPPAISETRATSGEEELQRLIIQTGSLLVEKPFKEMGINARSVEALRISVYTILNRIDTARAMTYLT